MEQNYKSFIETFYKFLYDINRYVPDLGVGEILSKYDKLDIVKVLFRVHKLLKNEEVRIKESDMSLWEKEMWILPSVNISGLCCKMNGNQQKKIMMYLNMLLLQTDIFYEERDFNPYVGVGNSNQDYSVNQIVSSIPTGEGDDEGGSYAGLESMMKLMGLDKMINMADITDKLKNMTDEDLEKYTEELKVAFGVEDDPETSKFLENIVGELTSDIKNEENPSFPKIIESFAPKFQEALAESNVDPAKLVNSAKNFMRQNRGRGGNFGGIDPFAMLDKFTSGEPMSEQECKKECEKMMKQVGLGGMKMEDMKGMNMQQMMAMASRGRGGGRGIRGRGKR